MPDLFQQRPEAGLGQETIILLATPGMRRGPQSPLARLVRQFEPYWRACQPPPLILSAEGSYRALLRSGLLLSYPDFYPLPPGFRGALVYASAIVISHALEDPNDLRAQDLRPVRVFYLIDPSDPTSVYPESNALKRDTVVAGKTFLATEAGIEEWLTLQLYATPPSLGQSHRFWLTKDELNRLRRHNPPASNIALVAHDKKKKQLLRYCLDHFDLIHHHFSSRYATGTTGDLLNGNDPKRPLDDTEIDDARKALKARLNGEAWVSPQPSGPRGGDTQIASRILDRQCRTVIFFEDPHYAREHEADIQLLERTSRIPDLRVLCLHDLRSAETWARNWEACLRAGIDTPATLVQTFRRVWNVDLIVVNCEREQEDVAASSDERKWNAIANAAAFYLASAICYLATQRRAQSLVVRVGIPWGYSFHEVVQRLADVRQQLRHLDQETERRLQAFFHPVRQELERSGRWPPRLTQSLDDDAFLRPGNVLVLPTIGVMGAYQREMEANATAAKLADLLGGESRAIGEYAFFKENVVSTPPLEEDLSRLDFLLLTGEAARPRFGSKAFADVPEDLWSIVRGSVGECAGLYLTDDGRPWETAPFQRQGITYEAIRRCAVRGGSIVIAGVQERRLPVVKAMLEGKLVSTLITDAEFAWKLMHPLIT